MYDQYTFRTLTLADVATLKALLRVYGDAFEDPAAYHQEIPSDAYLSALLAKSHFVTVVAETAGGQVVGGLSGYVLDKFERNRRELYIYDLAVLEAHRRQGVATGLINELKRVAVARDVYAVFVQADPEDAPAIALYETYGARQAVFHFDIVAPPETAAAANEA